MKLQNAVLAVAVAAGIGMIASLAITPVPVQSSETLGPDQYGIIEQITMVEQFSSIEQLNATPVLDCHNGSTHAGARTSVPVDPEQLVGQDGTSPVDADAENEIEGDSHSCGYRCYCHTPHAGRNYNHQHCYIPDYC